MTRARADVDRGRGSESLYQAQMPGLVRQLALRARIESVKASSALEGIIVPDDRRADRIIGGGPTTLRTRSEQELAGYRDALDYVWQQDWRPVNVGSLREAPRLVGPVSPVVRRGVSAERLPVRGPVQRVQRTSSNQ